MRDAVACWRDRLYAARKSRPFTLTFACIVPIPGILALIFGDRVSQAMTNLGAGSYIRIVGILLLIGAVTTIHALVTGRVLNECIGMVLTAVGLLLYGFGVIIGLLPLGGIVAGCIAISAGIGHILSLFSLTGLARLTVHDHGAS